MNCPECGAKQDDNGMLAWCNNGHMYKIPKTSPRYDDGTNSKADGLLARSRAEADRSDFLDDVQEGICVDTYGCDAAYYDEG